MTLAELTKKVEAALQANTPFVEQVKVTLQVVAEQLNALKTLDGYYTQNLQSLTQLTATNQLLVKQAQELLEKVEQSRAEAEAIVNARIDKLGTNLNYKSLIKVKTNDLVLYAGKVFVPKEEFTASSWEIDKNKLIEQGGSSSGGSSSNAYEAGKEIKKGNLITHNGKLYIAKEDFTATEWATDESKLIEQNTGTTQQAYAQGVSIIAGNLYTHENKIYVALESFTATDWASDESKFVEQTSGGSVADLSNYYTKEQVDLLLNGKTDLLTAGTGVEVTKQDGTITVGVKDYNKITSDIAEIAKTINTGVAINKKQFSIQVDFNQIGDKDKDPSEYIKPTDDAKGASFDDIMEFAGVYPLVLSPNGIEFNKLNPNDYSKFTNGGDASQYIITLGNDVMVKHSLRGLRLRRLNGNIGELTITDDLSSKDFTYNAFYAGGERKDCFYMGAYEGFVSGDKLYSTSGQYPATNRALAGFRNTAQARGAGYNIVNYEQWLYYQALWLLTHRDLNSQRKIGKGNCNTNGALKTGETNQWGANSELIKTTNPTYLTDGKHSVKSNYVENPWSNIWEWRDGFLLVGTKITTSTGNFNDAGLGYEDKGYAFAGGASGQNIASVSWDNARGFYPTQIGGDNEAYFASGLWQASGCAFLSGGAWAYGSSCGVFCVVANFGARNSYVDVGARLVKM